TVVVVSHRPEVLRAADHWIEVGPGAGAEGGEIVAAGPAAEVLASDSPTALALREPVPTASGAAPEAHFRIVGARANNLQNIDVDLPTSGFVCLTGVSGSGKSSLLFDVLGASMQAGAPVECDRIEWVGEGSGFPLAAFDELTSSRDVHAGQTVLSSLDLMPALQSLYHGCAKGTDLKKAAFSYLSPSGRCETCKGTGREEVALDVLADLALPCPACGGARYRPSVLEVLWEGRNAAEFLDEPIAALGDELPAGKLQVAIDALLEVGLGYLSLGRRRDQLSGGERQRLGLAQGLIAKKGRTLYLLDEPATGLHESDLRRLAAVLHQLAERGHLIVAAEHRTSLIAAADAVLELGPGSGAAGGRLV
ncbi:MAG: ABC-ATPase UvrA, partial [Planctomycetota bacterium]